jgi:hypothetical protein
MNDATSSPSDPGWRRPASTKGKLRGPKPPLRVGQVWSIRARLQLERRVRDLALFNLAIDSKLRGCSTCGSTPCQGLRSVSRCLLTLQRLSPPRSPESTWG